MGTVRVVNMIPASLSGETNQDSEPNLAVNPSRPTDIVGTAFTPAPMGGSFAPIYVSTDGGNTWSLRTVVPGNDTLVGTHDITVGFGTSSGVLYAGTLNGSTGRMNILRTANFASTTPMTMLVDRGSVDQPWVVAASVVATATPKDRVWVGNEDGARAGGRTAGVDLSQDAATAPAPAGFTSVQLERRATVVIAQLGRGKDGPPIRLAWHPDGTVYAAFQRWASGTFPDLGIDVTVTRDDSFGAGAPPFGALVDPSDGQAGRLVATNRFVRFNAQMGQERLGGDLSIALDPRDAGAVWIAWCDRVGGAAGTDWTLHVRRSTDRGQTWSADVRTITNAKNPALAVSSSGLLGLAYQAFTGSRWVTTLEVTADSWTSAAETHVLHTAPSTAPARGFLPYIGDYIRLQAVGRDFYGVFSGNNTPDMANFPSGIRYQRGADFATRRLLGTDGVTPVAVSVDPFFYQWSELSIKPISRGPIARGPIERGPIERGPIERGPIERGPIERGPILPEPPPREPIIRRPPPVGPERPAPRQDPSEEPRDLDL
jgi:hypothetical protein